jgi:hypothetical protein
LYEQEIFPEEIYVNVNISDKLSISINEIRLVIKQKEGEEHFDELKRAVNIIEKEVGDGVFIAGEFIAGEFIE